MRLVKIVLQPGMLITYHPRRGYSRDTDKAVIYCVPSFGFNLIGVLPFDNNANCNWLYTTDQIFPREIKAIHGMMELEEMLSSEYASVRELGHEIYAQRKLPLWRKFLNWVSTSKVTIAIEEAKCIS